MAQSKRQPAKRKSTRALVPAKVAGLIHEIRGEQVMLDSDLAALYGVETRTLVQAVSRNKERFPKDFMFRINAQELDDLKSQSVMSSGNWGGRRTRPLAFTEEGVAMLSSVLRSRQAVGVNIEIMRAFVELRHIAHDHERLAKRVDELERAVGAELGKQSQKVDAVFKMLREVTLSPKRKHPAGFAARAEKLKPKGKKKK